MPPRVIFGGLKMKSMFRVVAGCIAVVGMVAAPANAGQKAEKIKLTPDSDRALIIVKTDRIDPPPTKASGYHLTLSPYDAENEALGGSIFGGRFTLKAKPNLFYDGYMVIDVRPGTYVVQEFSRQDLWALCFNDKSVSFTVKPGEAVFLGDFDARGMLRELEMRAITSGRVVTTGALVHFFDGPAPRFSAPTEAGVAEAQTLVDTRMPKATVTVRPVEYQGAKFGTGRDLFGTNRVCGGYYSGSASKD